MNDFTIDRKRNEQTDNNWYAKAISAKKKHTILRRQSIPCIILQSQTKRTKQKVKQIQFIN